MNMSSLQEWKKHITNENGPSKGEMLFPFSMGACCFYDALPFMEIFIWMLPIVSSSCFWERERAASAITSSHFSQLNSGIVY